VNAARLVTVSLDIATRASYLSSFIIQATSRGATQVKRRYAVTAGRIIQRAASVDAI